MFPTRHVGRIKSGFIVICWGPKRFPGGSPVLAVFLINESDYIKMRYYK